MITIKNKYLLEETSTMAYSSNSSTGSVGTSSMGSSVGTTSTGTSGVSVGTSASTGMSASTGPSSTSSSTSGSTGTPNNTGFTGLSFSNGTWSPNSNSLGTLSLGTPGLSGFASNNFGTGWSGNDSSSEHTMTVDEVYGKSDTSFGNQSIVESQGDYNATSNEKSNVETSTFGKQDDITVTPESVTENKGIVDNSTIESIEGLNFQQKDKESQDVLEARKSRDDAEAEDKSNQMRDSLKAKTEQTTEEDAVNQLQIGEENTFEEQNNAKLNELNHLKQRVEDADRKVAQFEPEKTKQMLDEREKSAREVIPVEEKAKERASKLIGRVGELTENTVKTFINKSEINELKNDIVELAKVRGLDLDPNGDIQDIARQYSDAVNNECDKNIEEANKIIENRSIEEAKFQEYYEIALSEKQELQAKYNKAQEDYKTWKSEYWVNDTKTKDEEVANTQSNAEIAFQAAKDEISKSNLSEETKSQALETINNVEASTKGLNEAADALAANTEDPSIITTYVNAIETYNKSLKNATKDNSLKNTDYNETFTEMVAKANDFDVTMPDGTKVSYAEFATDMATKSPALAKGLYEAKAARLEEEGHTILSRIERAKAEMVTTWLGSKFTFADNQVRNQFNQMAKTDMRATYAAYNNVLNDPNATPERKAEASAAINQANALMTASVALQASTGFLSGIGDSMSDGVYGVTDPTTLNAYQKTLNAIDNYAKITLGLGVTPSANKAYQNMYYMAGAKVNESALFGRDFDSDGFALCQEYGNSAAAGMITGAGELATGVALFFNPATTAIGLNLVIDSVQTFKNGLYGVQTEARKSQQYAQEVLSYFNEAESIATETGNKEVINAMSATMSNAVKQIENFKLKADEVGNLDNWLEGSGSNTATNEKFNQSLTYDEWLKLIEADPTMRDYAKKLIAEKKEK